MALGATSWARLAFAPSTGKIAVDGDLFAVLGINSAEIVDSTDPFSFLPDSVARSLIEGEEITRDDELSLVIIPGKAGFKNTVTLISEKIADDDLVSDMAGGVVGFSPDGTILRWNRRMTHLFGPHEKDVKRRNASDILPAPVLYNWASVISSAHLGHEVRVEFRPSGERRVEGILTRGGPGVIGLFRDSTENYKNGKRLRALNRLNQAYLQSSGTGLLLLDSRLRILLSNPGFSRLSGYLGSLIGLPLHEVLSTDSFKWIHDASEHLFAEEISERSGVVSFFNKDGERVILRQTLRVVRNEANQAANYVCLFEDETKLTQLEEEVEHFRSNLLGISAISEELLESGVVENKRVLEYLLKITRSKAIALYTYDLYEDLKLKGIAGNWPKDFPLREPGDYSFPSSAWSSGMQYRMSSIELGRLQGHFTSSTILPIGSGVSIRGYLLLAESVLTDSDSELFKTLSSLLKIQYDVSSERIARSSAERFLEHNAGVTDSLFNVIPFPIAVILMDGSVEHWNYSMELLSGVRANQVDTEDVSNLIDPERVGNTLDSLVSKSNSSDNVSQKVWAIVQRNGSKSIQYRWNVSMLDSSIGSYKAPAFLISGIPSDAGRPPADYPESILVKADVLEDITSLLTVSTSGDVLNAVSSTCFRFSGNSIIEFNCEGKHIATFPEGKVSATSNWDFSVDRFILGREYHINAKGSLNLHTLDRILDILSLRSSTGSEMYDHSAKMSHEMLTFSMGLAAYIENFASSAVEENNAILQIVEKNDPIAGFARTMLYSHQTGSRASHLLRLCIQVKTEDFRIEHPDRFLTKLLSIFSSRGFNPPSLSFTGKMTSVLIIPEVLLQSFAILCQLTLADGVVAFTASTPDEQSEKGVLLTLSGIEDRFELIPQKEITAQLKSGRFTLEAEVSIIFSILKAAGCSLISADTEELSFILQSVD